MLQVKRNISKIRLNVTEDLWTLFQGSEVLKEDAWTGKVRDRLKAFEQDLLRSMKSDGWDGTEDESAVQWTFAGALFYSIIVITTIGKHKNCHTFHIIQTSHCDCHNHQYGGTVRTDLLACFLDLNIPIWLPCELAFKYEAQTALFKDPVRTAQ